MAQAMEAAGKLEEAYLTAPASATHARLDMPPAYDDIPHLHVALPVVALSQNQQAGPLPKKEKPAEADDQA